MKSLDQVRSEFDRIAELSSRLPDVVGPHEAALIEQLPRGMSIALDIGCGTGAVARRLAARCDRVVGIDFSPQMIREAANRSAEFPTVEYHVAAAEEWLGGSRSYDCITTMAVLHHMPLEPTVRSIARAVRPGGIVLIVDLTSRPGLRNLPLNAIALVAGRLRDLILKRVLVQRKLRRAWEEHGGGETYLTIAEAREVYSRLLPGSRVRDHLIWRYSVLWRKPVGA